MAGSSDGRAVVWHTYWVGWIWKSILPTPAPVSPACETLGGARGINDAGAIVGWYSYRISIPDHPCNFVVPGPQQWDSYSAMPRETVSVHGWGGSVEDINNLGASVGRSTFFAWNVYRYQNGVTEDTFFAPDPWTTLADTSSGEAASLNRRNATSGVIEVVGNCIVGTARRATHWEVVVSRVYPVTMSPTFP